MISGNCEHCGVHFAIEENNDIPGHRETEEVICPECGKVAMTVSTSGFPGATVIDKKKPVTEEEKLEYVLEVFEQESKLLEKADNEFCFIEKFWLHKYLSTSNFGSIKGEDIKEAYEIAVGLDKS